MDEIKQMIQDEIRLISNLEERVMFKKLIEGVFMSLYETNERMYWDLERRVMDELSYEVSRYEVLTGLVERSYYDNSHNVMSAMFEDDITAPINTAGEIRNVLKENGTFRMASVFIKCDYIQMQDILSKETFRGILKAERDYPIPIRLVKANRYLNKIEQLYHLFMRNGIPWQTINAPYLYKMADVMIESLPSQIPDNQYITDLLMDFGEYNHLVFNDLVPLWNIQHLELKSAGFPIACGDYENYEHVIPIGDYGTEHAYLVEEGSGIKKVTVSGESLRVTGKVSKSKLWDIYIIRREDNRINKVDRLSYPVMENIRKDEFAERFLRKSGQTVKTKGELERFIRGFSLDEYIIYEDCVLQDGDAENAYLSETYAMNFFLEDEIRDREGNRQLILMFKGTDKEPWLNRDLASFITSEVQKLYPEYQCGGILL